MLRETLRKEGRKEGRNEGRKERRESERAVAPVCYGVAVWLHRVWCSQCVSNSLLVFSFLCLGRCEGSHAEGQQPPNPKGWTPAVAAPDSLPTSWAHVQKVSRPLRLHSLRIPWIASAGGVSPSLRVSRLSEPTFRGSTPVRWSLRGLAEGRRPSALAHCSWVPKLHWSSSPTPLPFLRGLKKNKNTVQRAERESHPPPVPRGSNCSSTVRVRRYPESAWCPRVA